jgi:aspartate racemase
VTRLGLIGGLGPESTIDYYRRILQLWREQRPGSAPAIVIDSLDVDLGIRLVQHDRDGLIDYLIDSVTRLANAGADFVAMAANTPHVVFDRLAERATVPLISIVEVCAEEAAGAGHRVVGLLGTRFTMESTMYPHAFAARSMQVVVPTETERAWLHERYIGELLRGVFTPETRAGVLQLMETLRGRGADAFVLAGTELPLLLGANSVADTPVLDSTELHVAAIVRRLLERDTAPVAGTGATRPS